MSIDKELDKAEAARKDIERGEEAKRVLEMPIVRDALSDLEKGVVNALIASDVNDDKRLKTLVATLQSVRAFEGRLRAYMVNSTIAEKDLHRAEEKVRTPRLWERFRSVNEK